VRVTSRQNVRRKRQKKAAGEASGDGEGRSEGSYNDEGSEGGVSYSHSERGEALKPRNEALKSRNLSPEEAKRRRCRKRLLISSEEVNDLNSSPHLA
jgi:hypothetical protein